jgi:CHASE1-domain containing sensor protein
MKARVRGSNPASESSENLRSSAFDSTSSTENAGGDKSNLVLSLLADGALILVVFIILCLGLLAALLSFFLLQNTEIELAKGPLSSIADSKANDLAHVISTTIGSQLALASFISVSLPYTNINYYNQYLPFLKNSALLSTATTQLNYFQVVRNNDVANFTATVRTFGSDFANFTIYSGLNAQGQKVSDVTDRVFYTTCIFVYPYASMASVLGLNPAANALSKNVTIYKAIATKKQAATDNVPVIGSYGIASGVIIYCPVFDLQGNITGIISGVFLADSILELALGAFEPGIFVIVRDTNATSDSAAFIKNTATSNQAYQILGRGPANVTALAEGKNMIRAAQNVQVRHVSVADRVWEVTFVATPDFNSRYTNPQKWVSLSISLVIMFVLMIAVIFLFFYRKLISSRNEKKRSDEKVNVLKINQQKLRGLLRKLAAQDVRNKATLDIMPDYLAVLSASGKIVHTNHAFDKTFTFSSEKWATGVMLGDILPKLGYNFYSTVGDNEITDTEAETPSSERFPVRVVVRCILDKQEASSPMDQGDAPLADISEVEAYVVLIRNMSVQVDAQEPQIMEN